MFFVYANVKCYYSNNTCYNKISEVAIIAGSIKTTTHLNFIASTVVGILYCKKFFGRQENDNNKEFKVLYGMFLFVFIIILETINNVRPQSWSFMHLVDHGQIRLSNVYKIFLLNSANVWQLPFKSDYYVTSAKKVLYVGANCANILFSSNYSDW